MSIFIYGNNSIHKNIFGHFYYGLFNKNDKNDKFHK
jgi:hypothetical protein